MVAKASQNIKKEKIRAKRARIDSITNKYMVNLAWGIFVIILLRFVESGFMSVDMISSMPTTMKVFAVIFGVIGAGLLVCGKMNVLEKGKTFNGYGLFALVMALGSAWIGFYAKTRNILGNIKPALLNLDSRWWISWGPIIAVVVYLVVTLVITIIRVAMIDKEK